MKVIHTEQAPAAVGPYSQAIRTRGTVYLSGQSSAAAISRPYSPLLIRIWSMS